MGTPKYVCVYRKNRTHAEVAAKHKRGTPLLVRADVAAFCCQRCGLVYWEVIRPGDLDSDLCAGFTKSGDPCKLPPEPGSRFCGHHQHLGDLDDVAF